MKICVVQDESSVLFLCFLVQEEKNGYILIYIFSQTYYYFKVCEIQFY